MSRRSVSLSRLRGFLNGLTGLVIWLMTVRRIIQRSRHLISRPCYDKYHRCPGWAGGGWKYAKQQRCDGGYVRYKYEDRFWRWKLNKCNTCKVIVLPYHFRWIDPQHYSTNITLLKYRLEEWWDDKRARA